MSPSLIQKSQGPCCVMTTGNVAKAGPLARLCRPNPESAFTKACLGFVNLFLSLSKLIYLMAGSSSSVSDAKMQTFRGTNLMANVYIFNSRLNFCYSAGLFCLCASISPCRTRWHLKFLEKSLQTSRKYSRIQTAWWTCRPKKRGNKGYDKGEK